MFQNNIFKKSWFKCVAATATVTVLASANALAAGPPKPSELDNTLSIILLIVIVGLLLAIGLLANVVLGAAQVYLKNKQKNENQTNQIAIKTIALCTFMSIAVLAMAQDTTTPVQESVTLIGGLSTTSFYTLIAVIGLEIIVILSLLYNLKLIISKHKVADLKQEIVSEEKVSSFSKWWDKFNDFKPLQKEKDILLDHDYDGINELDNNLPGWWKYGFYLSIFIGVIYLYRYEIAHSAPSSTEEFKTEMAKAEKEKEEYLKNAANKVDENSVTLLTDAKSIDAGQGLYSTNCSACHAADGGGLVGPNLTDDYWLHGGSVKDIFKTIKYGVPEKGMKAWETDFSPIQIAQLSSFIKSLKGKMPATPKEQQGEVYKGE
jgi:cytochrome c oxidase cbb3-type subunit 3